MKSNFKLSTGPCQAWSLNKLPLKNFILTVSLFLTTLTSVQAQEVQYSNPSWWFGAAAGANFNFYRGSTQVLNENFTPPTAFHDGFGAGLYLAPLLEYHRPNSAWGFMFQAGYDSRRGNFDQVMTPCNCPEDLSTKSSYLTIEPSIRLARFKSNFY